MENLSWLSYNNEKKIAHFSSVDAISILCFLKNRDFQITEMKGLKKNKEKDLLREGEERFWVKENHYVEISSLIEENEAENICSLIINLKNENGLYFSYGQLSVKLDDDSILKDCTIKILEQYGYYAGKIIWDIAVKEKYDIPIYFLLGMQEKDINNDDIKRMKIHAENVHKASNEDVI